MPLDRHLDIFLFPRQRRPRGVCTHYCFVQILLLPLSEASASANITELKAANVSAGEVSRQVQHIVDSALPLLLKAFDTDDDKEAVTAAVLGCGVILTGAGAQSCQKYMEAMATGSSMVRQHQTKNKTMAFNIEKPKSEV